MTDLGARVNKFKQILVARVNTEAETGICLLVAEVRLTLEDSDTSFLVG